MTEPDFKNNILPAENAGKTGFLAFSRDFIISFFWFFAQRCILTMLKTWLSPIFKKIFFRPKMTEICRKSPFLQIFMDFFHIFLCFFTQRHDWFIIIPIIKPESIVNNNWFLHPKLSKNPYSILHTLPPSTIDDKI